MQTNLEPMPSLDTPNVLGRDAFQNVNDMVRSLATLQSGNSRPLGIRNGEFWCRDLDGNGSMFQVYRYIEITTPDGVQQLDVPWTIKLAQSISGAEEARNDISPSEKAISQALAEKIDKSAISSAIDSVSEETVASSKAVSGLRNVLSDSFISGLGMPNLDKKISIKLSKINNEKPDYSAAYTAPANGWVTVYGQVANIASKAYALVFAQSGDIRMTSASGTADVVCTATIPVSKGRGVYLKTQSCWYVGAYFLYAIGEK